MRAIAVAFAVVAVLAGLISWMLRTGPDGADLPSYWDVPEFALVNQQGDTVRSGDLAGQVWIASFVFTNCTDICPVISGRLARVRDTLAAEGLLGEEVRLVSISVDPARDTPAVLLEYARRFGGSPPSEWAFLTGTPPEAVRALVQQGFRVTALDPAMEHGMAYQVEHSPRILVVDRQGRVRGAHDVTEGDVVARLLSDARKLAG
jgi:protein SCO1/2